MSQMSLNNPLHIPDLFIESFRGVKNLSIPKLGRVTFFVGRNGVGKTTVLEAVSLFAARARFSALFHLLKKREECEIHEREQIPVAALFHDWNTSSPLVIGPKQSQLKIEKISINDLELNDKEKDLLENERNHFELDNGKNDLQFFKITFLGKEYLFNNMRYSRYDFPRRLMRKSLKESSDVPESIKLRTLGAGLLDNEEIGGLWDDVALTDDEGEAIKNLSLILGDQLDRIAVVGEERGHGRRVIARLRNRSNPVPLKSLGDGAIRLFGMALSL